jgi:hypothetical protein
MPAWFEVGDPGVAGCDIALCLRIRPAFAQVLIGRSSRGTILWPRLLGDVNDARILTLWRRAGSRVNSSGRRNIDRFMMA